MSSATSKAAWALALVVLVGPIALRAQVPVSAQVVNADRYPEVKVSFPGGVIGYPDLPYGSAPGRSLLLDLYVPPAGLGGSARPFFVYVHGGGWSGGSARTTGAFENWPAVLASIAARGYVVASINYRLTAEAKYPANIKDVKAAIRWMRSKANQYGIDKSRGAVGGVSAGGHLAALAATSCGAKDLEPDLPAGRRGGGGRGPAPGAGGRGPAIVEQSPTVAASPVESDCVEAAVLWYGYFDFTGPRENHTALFTCPPEGCPKELLKEASPSAYVNPKSPPMIIIVGDKDQVVGQQQSIDFDKLLRDNGVKSELHIIPGVGHSFIGVNQEETSKASNFALDKSLEFLDATFGVKQPTK
jgi:acetyl esterase/lipase